MKSIISQKVKDYLKYAFGEIILVTIGILFAFSINNWKEKKNNDHLKNELIIELYGELQQNLDRMYYLDTDIITALNMKTADSLFSKRAYAIQDGIDSSEFQLVFGSALFRYNTFNLNNEVFNSLNDSKIINSLDDTVKIAIKKYYRLLEREDYYNTITYDKFEKYIDATRYGYLEARRDFKLDSINGLRKHQWIYNTTSKEFIDLRICLEKINENVGGSRARMLNIIDESKKLIRILEPLKNEIKTSE